MRWVVTLVTLSLGVWYLTNRRRRGQLQETVQDATPQEVQTRAWNMATTASDTAQEFAQKASKTAGDAAANVQQASGGVTDRAQQAVNAATQGAQQAAGTGTGTTQQTQQTTDTPPASGSAVETDVNTPPPSIHETAQAEMADVNAQVDSLRAQSEAPPDPAEKSAGEVFGAGSMATTDVHAAQAPATAQEAETVEGGVKPLGADQTLESGTMAAAVMREGGMGSDATPSMSAQSSAAPTTDEGATPAARASATRDGGQGTAGRTLMTDDSIVPEGERPRPIADEGTTTASGGTVDPLSPDPDRATATGKPAPTPPGLTTGEPGTGGPATSTIAPSTPDSVETPTTGMETAPVVDRAAEVAERTGGKIVGNKKTRVFHLASAADLPGESNRVYFDSVEEATGAGFTPTPDVDFRDL